MPVSIPIIVYTLVIVLIAGYVRGYSGFGASMIIVVGLSLFYPLTDIVPAILLLEIIASSYLLPKVFRQVDWSSLSVLLIGVLVGTPLGVYLLSNLPDSIMRFAVSMIVIALIPLLWRGYSLKKMPGTKLTVFTGAISGIINGSAAIGGPPVILFYFSSPKGTDISRASLIAFFLVTDIMASGACAFNGLITVKTFWLAGISIIPLVIGLTLGSHSFFKTDPAIFRKRVLLLLLVMAITTLGRSFIN
ncbi:sulfite exporter TauE/SafE family protein [bacterium]|nr:sulfite exporter TauE/SafE family protein [bacterium]